MQILCLPGSRLLPRTPENPITQPAETSALPSFPGRKAGRVDGATPGHADAELVALTPPESTNLDGDSC